VAKGVSGGAETSIGQWFPAVIDDGKSGEALSLSGYSIVEARDLAEAATLTEGHHFLSEGLGSYAIDLFELMPVPFEA
jgi:hypothetical protein